jgi:hypothetical protein
VRFEDFIKVDGLDSINLLSLLTLIKEINSQSNSHNDVIKLL